MLFARPQQELGPENSAPACRLCKAQPWCVVSTRGDVGTAPATSSNNPDRKTACDPSASRIGIARNQDQQSCVCSSPSALLFGQLFG